MRKIRSKWTQMEVDFQEAFPKALGHPPKFPHSPDFIYGGKAVFLDSAFWHGYVKAEKYASMTGYWQDKLFRNVLRDVCAMAFYGKYCLRLLKWELAQLAPLQKWLSELGAVEAPEEFNAVSQKTA